MHQLDKVSTASAYEEYGPVAVASNPVMCRKYWNRLLITLLAKQWNNLAVLLFINSHTPVCLFLEPSA